MSVIKKITGKILFAATKAITVIMHSLIQLIETIVLLVRSISKGFIALISMGGCLLFLFLVGPLGIGILMNPVALLTLLFFLLFPILGNILVSYLNYLKYIVTGYLFNLANYLMDGINYKYKSFGQYKAAYKKAEEERKSREQRRYYEQQREWEERLRQWHQQNSQRSQGGYGAYGGQGSYAYGNSYVNPAVEFKNKYEKSCKILGVSYDVDKYKIKLAYRRKAKEYHPDLNKALDATSRFQEITNAYEFLNDDNIQRYKSL